MNYSYKIFALIIISILSSSTTLFSVQPTAQAAQTAQTVALDDLNERNIPLDNSMTYDRHTFWNTTGTTISGSSDFDDKVKWKSTKAITDASVICPKIMKNTGDLGINNIFFNKHNYTEGDLGMLYVKTTEDGHAHHDHKKFVCAKITSNYDKNGIYVILEETSEVNMTNVLKVTGKILVTSVHNSSSYNLGPNIQVAPTGDTISATVMDGNHEYHTITADFVPPATTANAADSGLGGAGVLTSPSLYPVSQTRYVCQTGQADDICGEWKTGGPLTIQFNGLTYIGPSCPDQYGVPCPALGHKDVFVQIDSINGFAPSDSAIQDLVNSLKGSTHGGYGVIYLHVQRGSSTIPSVQYTSFPGCTAEPCPLLFPDDFTKVKNANFAFDNSGAQDQKSQAYHYVLFGYEQSNDLGSSGVAELPGNDVYVTLGDPKFNDGINPGPGSVMEQESTFMHELGHNLGLDHGGKADPTNCKPNYLSVMNYIFQFNTLVPSRPLDWSRSAIIPLYQNSLSEPTGIAASSPTGLQTTYGNPLGYAVPPLSTGMTNVDFDWNSQTNPESSTSAISLPNANINQITSLGCAGNAGTTLLGSKDWSTGSISFPFRSTSAFKMGLGLKQNNDITTEKLNGMLLTRLMHINYTLQTLPTNTKNTLNDFLLKAKFSTEQYKYLQASQYLHIMKLKAIQLNVGKNILDTISSVNLSFKETTSLPRPVTFDQTVYGVGDQVAITVTDPDADLNNKTLDQVNVHISSNADPAGFDKLFTETGADTGIFKASTIKTASSGTNSTGGFIQVQPDDVITAQYGVFSATASVSEQHPVTTGNDVTIVHGAGTSPVSGCVSANNCFDPNPMTVAPGSMVQWTNTDAVSHTVSSGKSSDNQTGLLFDSGLIKPGKTFQFTFTEAGTYDYFCVVHPWMTGQVVVSGSNSNTSLNGTNITVQDSGGNALQNSTVYQPLVVKTNMTNPKNTPQSYQYVLQVKDSNNKTISQGSTSGIAPANVSVAPVQSWTPTVPGKYIVSTYALDPNTHKLLSNPLTRTFTVK